MKFARENIVAFIEEEINRILNESPSMWEKILQKQEEKEKKRAERPALHAPSPVEDDSKPSGEDEEETNRGSADISDFGNIPESKKDSISMKEVKLNITNGQLKTMIQEEVDSYIGGVVKEARGRPIWARGGATYDKGDKEDRYWDKADVPRPPDGSSSNRYRDEEGDEISFTMKELPDVLEKIYNFMVSNNNIVDGAPTTAELTKFTEFFADKRDLLQKIIDQTYVIGVEAGPNDEIATAMIDNLYPDIAKIAEPREWAYKHSRVARMAFKHILANL